MPAEHLRYIAPNGPLEERLDSQVATGEYVSVRDLTRTAIRLLREQDQSKRPGTKTLSSPTENRA